MSDPSDDTPGAPSDTPEAPSAHLLTLLADAPPLEAFLDQVVRLAAKVVDPPASCGITLRRDGQEFTVVTSSDLAAQVDEIQYGADQGPCLDSIREGTIVQVDDLSQETRWDTYRPHAIAHGVISSLSLPLTVEGRTQAGLNLYSNRPATFAGPPRQHTEALAAQCAAALTLALRQANQAQLQQQLLDAIASRSVIDQAVGILMGQQRCNATDAFTLLRQASQHRNRKLRDVAADIITNLTGEPPHPPAGFKLGPTSPSPPR